jgi:LmbE family N-acetylglucosaminyl deacetylase
MTSRTTAGDKQISEREAAAARAHKCLGVSSVTYLAFPDNRLDSVPLLDIVRRLEGALSPLAPDVI